MKNYNKQNFFKEVSQINSKSKLLFTKISIFIFILISCESTKAQFNELKTTSHAEWEINNALFNNSGGVTTTNKKDWPEQVFQSSDGGYVVVGFSSGGGENNNIITKYGSHGNKIWEYQFPCAGSLIDVTETSDNYVAVGYSNCNTPQAGLLFKIHKDGDISTAKAVLIESSGFGCVKPEPNGNGVIVCGTGSGVGSNNNLLIFSIAESAISDDPTTISSLTPVAFGSCGYTWFSNIGYSFYTSYPSMNVIPIGTRSSSSPWPIIPSASISGGSSITPATAYYNEFGGQWLAIENRGSGTYKVYVTGSAQWNTFTSPSFTLSPNPAGTLFFISNDVMAACFTAPTGASSIPVTADWAKVYSESVNDATTSDYHDRAYSQFSPRATVLPTGYSTNLQDAIRFYNNTLDNGGTFIDIVGNNTSNLVIGAVYNNYYYQGNNILENTGAFNGEEYKDGDIGALLIQKSSGAPVNSANYVDYIGHLSGDDFKLRMTQNAESKLYMVGSTADTRMGLVSSTGIPRRYSSSGEDFLIGKLNPNSASGTHVSVEWLRDVLTDGDPDRSTVDGICGFGTGLTKDDGFVVCGNNNQISTCEGEDDDMCIVKFSPDCHSNYHYTDEFEPYQIAKHYSVDHTISSNIVSGRQIVVESGVTLTIQNCTIEFANSAWIYDHWDLNINNTDANPEHGGFIGIKVEEGGI